MELLELLIVGTIASIIVIGPVLGFRNARNAQQHYNSLKDQLKNKYNLSEGDRFSIEDQAGRQIWFSTSKKENFTPGEVYGSDSMKHPSFCGVSCEFSAAGLFDFSFMLLNNNKHTRRTSYFPYREVNSSVLSEKVKDHFYVVGKGKDLPIEYASQIQFVAQQLLSILREQTRYTIAFRKDRITVYIDVHSIDTFEDLEPTYQVAMQCVDVLLDKFGAQSKVA